MESTVVYEFKRCLRCSNIMVSLECSKCKDKMSSGIFKLKILQNIKPIKILRNS